ncbi:hypothetical protein HDU93_009418 [Gonapodya sp. JEL0774]|nr:hypothetical protein HDU93_009418 [Gonapodya sp. JEL0774]
MAKVDFVISDTSEPTLPPAGQLPSLMDGPHYGHRFVQGHDLDVNLNGSERAEIHAYTALIENELYDALVYIAIQLYNRFTDSENFTSSTQYHLSRTISFPSRYWTPQQIRTVALERTAMYGRSRYVPHTDLWAASSRDEDRTPERESDVYINARACFRALESKLGRGPFLFGKRPSSLDAVLLAHLLHHLANAPPELPHHTLSDMITNEFPRLLDYARRHRTYYLPLGFEEHHLIRLRTVPSDQSRRSWYSSLPQLSNVIEQTVASTTQFLKRLRHDRALHAELWKWSTVFGAIGAFAGYVVWNGIIEIKIQESEEDENDGREEETRRRVREVLASMGGVPFQATAGEGTDSSEGENETRNDVNGDGDGNWSEVDQFDAPVEDLEETAEGGEEY